MNLINALRILLFLPITALFTLQAVAQEEVRPVGKRIIGCEKTKIKNHPWQVAFDVEYPDGKKYLCGGTIISKNWILTAAHCFSNLQSVEGTRFKSGSTIISKNSGWVTVEKIIQHSSYNPITIENDIALVKTKSKINGKILPLASQSNIIPEGQILEVTGWGLTEEGSTSDTLCKANVRYITNSECNKSEAYDGKIKTGMLCAGDPKQKKDACGGDSGGPLVWHNSETGPILAGVVSWGDGCAKKNKPGVYTRVSEYRDWIKKTIEVNKK